MDGNLPGNERERWLTRSADHTRSQALAPVGKLKPARPNADAKDMRRVVRENALCASVAAAASAAMAWLGLYGFAWNDYDNEARPALEALGHWHVLKFLQLAPAYGGSLIERAPFAVIPGLWGGGDLAVYRMLALPCLLAGAALGVWLVARMRSEGSSRLARAVTLAVCVANPVTLCALELGHPEELLGASLCVAAVLVAARPSIGHRGALLVVEPVQGITISSAGAHGLHSRRALRHLPATATKRYDA